VRFSAAWAGTTRWKPALERAGLVLLTVAAFGWRLDRAEEQPYFFDEGTSFRIAEQIFDPEAPWPRHGGDHPSLGVYLLGLSGWIFGRDALGYRLLNVLAGSMTVPLLALAVARSATRGEALAAALLLAVNPCHIGLSALAIEIPFQVFFVTLALAFAAHLPGGGRHALFGCAAALGLGFMCSESTALVLVGWLIAVLLRPERVAGLRRRDFVVAAGLGLAVIAQDLHYNLTATRSDFYYVNYLDHWDRISRLSFGLHGVGFFLRDLFERLPAWLPASLWQDHRGEYTGPGVVLGVLLLLGWLHSFREAGDPSRGLWRWPVHVLVFVTTFAGMRRPSDMLDAATWTWPVPILVLATASTARFCCRQRVPAWLLLLVLLLSMHFVEPASPAPWK
jgi:4-amino-4-deoxy-L-arabinose transferase-like glycosyltransferase